MTRAARVIAFIERYCVTPDGAQVGQPLVLAEFQKDFIRDVYDNPAGTRRAILSVSRKNGKSGLIAGLLLAHLVGPEAKQNSQIVSGAMSRDGGAGGGRGVISNRCGRAWCVGGRDLLDHDVEVRPVNVEFEMSLHGD